MKTNLKDKNPANDFINHYKERIDLYLDNFLSTQNFQDFDSKLLEAIRYSVLNGGKRIRPLLVYVSGEALGADINQLDAPAAAVELIHCYSLIHDDLPAMDNDDLRRGKPTCHRAFNEANAILAGDALQSLAFELLSDPIRNPITALQQIKMVNMLAKTSGILGMVGGQAIDIQLSNTPARTVQELNNQRIQNNQTTSATVKNNNEETIENHNVSIEMLSVMHQKKTGALIQAAVQLGAIAANCNEAKVMASLRKFAENLGLAFQVQDDILDVEGSVALLGKNPGQDAVMNKQTFTAILGLEAAKIYMQKLHKNALQNIQSIETLADNKNTHHARIHTLIEYLLHRQS